MKEPIVSAGRSTIAKTAQATDTPDKAYEVRSDKTPGLLLRVEPSGNRTFYVQVARGKRVRIGKAGTFTLRQAEERAKEILINPDAALRKKTDALTLGEYITQHYTDHALAKLKNGQKSLDRVNAVWVKLLNKRISEISASEIDKFRNKRINEDKVKPATVNRDISALSGVLRHWVKNNKGAVHPLSDMEPLEVADDEIIRYLSPDESKRLRKALADRDAQAAKERASANKWRADRGRELMPEIKGYSDHVTPMVLVSLNTGIRQGELFAMKWESVNLEHKTLSVLASHSKGNKTRTIPLNAEVCTVFEAIRPKDAKGLVFVSPITDGEFDNVKKAWAEVVKEAGITDFRWHDLRHDFASQLVMKGASLYTVQKLLGHSNPKTTQRYARLAPHTLADAVGLL